MYKPTYHYNKIGLPWHIFTTKLIEEKEKVSLNDKTPIFAGKKWKILDFHSLWHLFKFDQIMTINPHWPTSTYNQASQLTFPPREELTAKRFTFNVSTNTIFYCVLSLIYRWSHSSNTLKPPNVEVRSRHLSLSVISTLFLTTYDRVAATTHITLARFVLVIVWLLEEPISSALHEVLCWLVGGFSKVSDFRYADRL